jgi:hypothetical protein
MTELGWEPREAATDALLELIDGIRAGSDAPTPRLARSVSPTMGNRISATTSDDD